MKILIVTQYFWPEEFRINDLVVGMAERGHEVTVLTGQPNYPSGQVFDDYRADPAAFSRFRDRVEVLRLPMLPRGSTKLGLALNYLSFAISGMILGPLKLRRRAFDAIFVFQISPITAALPAVLLRRLKRAPLMIWVLDVWPDTLPAVGVSSPTLLRLVGSLVRYIYARCDRILVQSRAFWEPVLREGGTERQLAYFPNWIEPTFLAGLDGVVPADEVRGLGAFFTVMFAGNIGESQDMPSVLDAAESLRDLTHVRWLIVGDGRAAQALRADVVRRGLEDRVVLLGRHPPERMPSFFAGADALLVSLRAEPIFALTIPGKVQNYMVIGCPLLGMIDGEGARIIEASGGGLAVAAGDGAGLGAAVRQLAAMSPDQLRIMGQAGRTYALREFDRDRLFDQFVVWAEEARAEFAARRAKDLS